MSKGSLLLLDPSAINGYDGGSSLPVDGSVINNLAWETAAAVIGSGTKSTLDSAFSQVGLVGDTSSKHKTEWTPKGGLHTIVSQSPGLSGTTPGEHIKITIAQLIADYIFNNTPGRDFYFSTWRKTTRAQGSSGAPQAFTAFNNSTAATANWLFYNDSSSIRTDHANKESLNPNTLEPHFSSAQFATWHGTKPGAAPSANRWAWAVGTVTAWASLNTTVSPSQVFYRFYLEDLTFSGRTYAQVNAIDKALYNAAFSSGGRFFGDSNTDPATIP